MLRISHLEHQFLLLFVVKYNISNNNCSENDLHNISQAHYLFRPITYCVSVKTRH